MLTLSTLMKPNETQHHSFFLTFCSIYLIWTKAGIFFSMDITLPFDYEPFGYLENTHRCGFCISKILSNPNTF